MCLLLILLLFGPRTAIVIWWLFSPERWEAAYSSFFVPFFGFLLLPWTTLTYTLVAPAGVNGFDYVLMGFAVLIDLWSYAAQSSRHQ